MAAAPSSEAKLTMKLLIDKKSNKVLFAEAGKEVVDFLFNLLSLPVGTVIRCLLSTIGMVGCLGNLYQSVEKLSDTYLQPNQHKDSLLKPAASIFVTQAPLLLKHHHTSSPPKTFYTCYRQKERQDFYVFTPPGSGSQILHHYVSDNNRASCPKCRATMSTMLEYVPSPNKPTTAAEEEASGGYVKGVVAYMVMDDLIVKPMSTISSIALLNEFNIKDLSTLQEKVVEMGVAEARKLLRASFESKTVLTSIFLENLVA